MLRDGSDESGKMTKQAGLRGLVSNLGHLKREPVGYRPLPPRLALLRAWQTQRLTRTYQDLLNADRYRPACLFFLEDIYAARDFSQRDHDIERMYEFTRRFVPDSLLRPVAVTVELHRLTEELDQALITALIERLGVTDTITPELYAEAYRLCDNYAPRVRQIELIEDICERIDGIVRNPIAGPTLSLARRPLHAAGYGELHEFLVRGYESFKRMHGSRHFRRAIKEREITILDRIYAGEADPFRADWPLISA